MGLTEKKRKTKGARTAKTTSLDEIQLDPKARPIWDVLLDIANSIPEEELDKLPRDLAENFEEYMYGNKR